ncbi:MAG: hypothetical protein VKN33_09640 [Candidatus Sericytochromatia bacterium]|nr:hypothetical protein [Candidatus Sericytochromatia bacterium]
MPHDLPLPLPLAVGKPALVIAFLVHIVFVNLMLGGTVLALHAHFLGQKRPCFERLAGELMTTVTVHKSLAVVLGVGPLLLLSVVYTVPFYTSSALIAPAWLSVLWLVTLSFSLLYAYKYGWSGWKGRHPRWHIATGVSGLLVLLCVPLIYLTNTQLMLDPAAMAGRPSFFRALWEVGNVIPRYFHFLLASLAVAGLWVMGWWGRERSDWSAEDRVSLMRFGGYWAIFATALQFVAGPVVLFTLPRGALTGLAVAFLALGVLTGLGAIFLLLDTVRGKDRYAWSVFLIATTVVCMGTTRHLIRESLLELRLSQDIGRTAVYPAAWAHFRG